MGLPPEEGAGTAAFEYPLVGGMWGPVLRRLNNHW